MHVAENRQYSTGKWCYIREVGCFIWEPDSSLDGVGWKWKSQINRAGSVQLEELLSEEHEAGKRFPRVFSLKLPKFHWANVISDFLRTSGLTWCQCNINLNRNWRLKWQFLKCRRVTSEAGQLCETQKGTVVATGSEKKKYLMNSIIFIWVQKNTSNRCICPWPNDRTACNLSRDFNFSYYRSSNGEEFHSLGETHESPSHPSKGDINVAEVTHAWNVWEPHQERPE